MRKKIIAILGVLSCIALTGCDYAMMDKVVTFYDKMEEVQKKVLPQLDLSTLDVEGTVKDAASVAKDVKSDISDIVERHATTEDMIAKIQRERKERSTTEKAVTEEKKAVTEEKKPVTEEKKPVTEANKSVTEAKKSVTEAKKTDAERKTSTTEKKSTIEEKKTTEAPIETAHAIPPTGESTYHLQVSGVSVPVNVNFGENMNISSMNNFLEVSDGNLYVSYEDSYESDVEIVHQLLENFTKGCSSGAVTDNQVVRDNTVLYYSYYIDDSGSIHAQVYQDIGVGNFVSIRMISVEKEVITRLLSSYSLK